MADSEIVIPHETANFRIGGRDIAVPALNLEVLDSMKDVIKSLDFEMTIVEYAKTVISVIVALRPDLNAETLRKQCSFPEAKNLIAAWSGLLDVSGFNLGEAEAASPGTGTLTGSSPNLEPETSVVETRI